jgi:2-succinyl-6-hydroxy-2,4-cyclohexadiene-1-carboxylate synthase
MDVRAQVIEGADGPLELTIAEAGAGGRPLVLVHGFTGAKEDFADFLDLLAEHGWHVVAPDLRGHGESAKPEDESAYTFDLFATDLLSLLDAVGFERTVVLGHSMGGMVVQTAALRAPERFEAIVLMDTSHRGLKADPGLVELGIAIAREEGIAAVMAAQDGLDDGPLGTPADQRVRAERPGYAEFGARKMLASSPAMYAAMLRTITDHSDDGDRLDDLRTLRAPTLVLVGDQDAPFLRPSERMAEAIPGAELVVIPDAGHSPQFEAPDAWWAALNGFLSRI